MCTYQTARLEAEGSAKGPEGWFGITDATVYFDHPVSAPWDHTLNIDFLQLGAGSPSRVAVELSPASARDLANAIIDMLDSAPAALLAASQSRTRPGTNAPHSLRAR
jgi:hypothetical protein